MQLFDAEGMVWQRLYKTAGHCGARETNPVSSDEQQQILSLLNLDYWEIGIASPELVGTDRYFRGAQERIAQVSTAFRPCRLLIVGAAQPGGYGDIVATSLSPYIPVDAVLHTIAHLKHLSKTSRKDPVLTIEPDI